MPDTITAATLATVRSARLLRRTRAFHSARGRASAADRNLGELLHPGHGLSAEQCAKIREARALIKSIDPDLRTLADGDDRPEGAPVPPLAIGGPLTEPRMTFDPTVDGGAVIPFRRR